MGAISIDGRKLYIERYGLEHKKALLYLHGGPGASCLDFRNQAQKISAACQVIAMDQYGVLRSDAIPADEAYGMQRQIEMLEQMRVRLGFEKWSLLGHSYGGMLACLYANLYPASISAVIYECPSFLFELSAKSVAEYLLQYFESVQHAEGIARCHEILKKAYQECDRSAAGDMLGILQLASGNAKVRNYLHNVSYEEYAASYSTEGVSSDMWNRSNEHFDKLVAEGKMFSNFLRLLKNNPQPSLLITGKYDPVCREDQIAEYEKNAPNGHVVEFEHSGHFPRIEEPEKYTECVCAFLAQYAG